MKLIWWYVVSKKASLFVSTDLYCMRRKQYPSNVALMRSQNFVIYAPYYARGVYCCAGLPEVRTAVIDGFERTVQTAAKMAEAILTRKQACGWESI